MTDPRLPPNFAHLATEEDTYPLSDTKTPALTTKDREQLFLNASLPDEDTPFVDELDAQSGALPDTNNMDEYQNWVGTMMGKTADGPRTAYLSLKGCGEAGEFAEKIGKLERDQGITEWDQIPPDNVKALAKELGDRLWYIAASARKLGLTLSTIALMNVLKLTDRLERDVLDGSGDDR